MLDAGRLRRAVRYRFRAEELRAICETWTDRQSREILDRLATNYDRLAAHLENLAALH